MALLDGAGTASPSTASNGSAGPGRTLDAPPPMPGKQTRPSNVLFTPPADDQGMGELGNDPMVQTMAASAAVDKAFSKLAMLYPIAVDPLSQLQQSFRQLIVGITTMQSQGAGGMGAPTVIPPLPQQSGSTGGVEQGPSIT